MASGKRIPNILIVDDNAADAELVREAFAENSIQADVHVAHSGEQALAFLRGDAGRAEAAQPDLILLDLQMPSMGGHEVLAQIRADARLRSIPVVVMTSSEHPQDVASAYENAANTYIVKPVQWGRLLNTVKALEQFWFNAARLPTAARE